MDALHYNPWALENGQHDLREYPSPGPGPLGIQVLPAAFADVANRCTARIREVQLFFGRLIEYLLGGLLKLSIVIMLAVPIAMTFGHKRYDTQLFLVQPELVIWSLATLYTVFMGYKLLPGFPQSFIIFTTSATYHFYFSRQPRHFNSMRAWYCPICGVVSSVVLSGWVFDSASQHGSKGKIP